jgi:hypothetical protein
MTSKERVAVDEHRERTVDFAMRVSKAKSYGNLSKPQIPPLRYAPVGMTRRVWWSGRLRVRQTADPSASLGMTGRRGWPETASLGMTEKLGGGLSMTHADRNAT